MLLSRSVTYHMLTKNCFFFNWNFFIYLIFVEETYIFLTLKINLQLFVRLFEISLSIPAYLYVSTLYVCPS